MVTLGEMKARGVSITLYCQPNEGPGCYHATTPSIDQLIQYFGVDFDISVSRDTFLGRFVCQKCGRCLASLRLGQGTDTTGINTAAGSHDHGPHISIEEATSRYHELEAERRRLGIKSNAELNADRGPSCEPPRKPNALVPGLSVRRTFGRIESGAGGFEVAARQRMICTVYDHARMMGTGGSSWRSDGVTPYLMREHFLTVQLSGPGEPGPAFYERTMPLEYRVIDLSSPTIDPGEHIVQSTSPERAVMEALGIEVVRSGSERELRARVYFQLPGQPVSMVRLYSKVGK